MGIFLMLSDQHCILGVYLYAIPSFTQFYSGKAVQTGVAQTSTVLTTLTIRERRFYLGSTMFGNILEIVTAIDTGLIFSPTLSTIYFGVFSLTMVEMIFFIFYITTGQNLPPCISIWARPVIMLIPPTADLVACQKGFLPLLQQDTACCILIAKVICQFYMAISVYIRRNPPWFSWLRNEYQLLQLPLFRGFPISKAALAAYSLSGRRYSGFPKVAFLNF